MTRLAVPPAWASYAQQIGVRLHAARIDADLSQEQLAARAGITRSTYAQLEKGLTRPGVPANPTLFTIVSLCQVLGVSIHEIVPPEAPEVAAWSS